MCIEVLIRPITEQDTSLILKWRNKDSVRKNFIYQEELTEEIHNEWLQSKISTGEAVQFIIVCKKNNQPIGSIYLSHIDKQNKQAELGIFIGEDQYKGNGIGGQAITLMKEYAFNSLKLNRIYLRLIKTNSIAFRCYEKCGFKEIQSHDDFIIWMETYRN